MRKTIKINFKNLWGGEGIESWKNTFFPFLNEYYDFVLSSDPDFIMFSNTYQKEMPDLKCNAQRVFFMGEVIDVDMSKCEWAFGYNYIEDPRYFRMPYYVLRLLYTGTPFDRLIKKDVDIDRIISEKTKFCNFLFSNTKDGKTRNDFFKRLSKYKRVDSVGETLNNMGYVLPGRAHRKVGAHRVYPEKTKFLSQYKFTIAYENDRGKRAKRSSGCTTEKIVEPMLVNSIPIYRGNSRIGEEFNTKSFISYHDFNTEDDMVNRIVEIDNDCELYREMLKEPWLHGNNLSKYLDIERLTERFREIFG